MKFGKVKIITVLYPINYFLKTLMTIKAVAASNPVVGSSRNRISGLVTNSIPILVRFLSPPDTPRIKSSPIYDYKILW